MEYTISMYILQVVPIIKLPQQISQTLTYYSYEDILPGTLIAVEVRTAIIPAIVYFCQELSKVKYQLKHTIEFQPKPIIKSFSQFPLLTSHQLELSQWISEYYAYPQGIITKWFLPKISTKIKRYPKILNTPHLQPLQGNGYQLKIFLGDIQSRIMHYQQCVQSIDGQIVIIVPDSIMLDYIAHSFSELDITLIHSKLSITEYRAIWMNVKSGKARIIIGTKTALFFPFYQLSHIIIEDEPSESYYNTDTKPHYHSILIAKKLATIHQATLTLASLIPSIQTLDYAHQNQFSIPEVFYPNIAKQETELVYMHNEFNKGNKELLSEPAIQAIQQSLIHKQSIIIYVNRRGESLYLACNDCGYHFRDPKTGSLLTVHNADIVGKSLNNYTKSHILMSHQSMRYFKMPSQCPQCKSYHLKQGGIGIEKIQSYIQHYFPHIEHFVLSRDTASDTDTQKTIIQSFMRSKPSILLSTRMIHKFLHLIPPTLTIIPSIESILNFPDYTIREKSTQTLTELIHHSHKTLIQTFTKWNPEEHIPLPIHTLLHNPIASIWEQEYQDRILFKYPPVYQILAIHSQHHTRNKSLEQSLRLKKALQHIHLSPLGPIETYLAKGKGIYQFTITIQAKPQNAQRIKQKIIPILEYGQEIEINPE